MNERIKLLRKKKGLTQTEFGKIIGVKHNTVTSYETGKRVPTDAVLLSICREFKVNEEWLKNGTGEMFQQISKNQQIGAFVSELMQLPDENFKKRFISAISKLDSNDWELLETIAKKLQESEKKEGN